MSLVMGEHGTSTSRRRRWPWVIVAVLLAAIVAAAFVAGRSSSTKPAGQAPAQRPGSSTPAPAEPGGGASSLQWAPAPGVPAAGPMPSSPAHGPQQVSGPIAAGYSHDELGAVLAGINISMRLSSDAGPGVYRSVIEQQTVGERQSTLTRLASEPPSASPPQPQHYWYRVRGDPDGEVVQLQLLAQTPQTAQMGGYVQLDRTVVWRDGDWALQLPVGQAQLVPSNQGFQPLEGL